MASPSKNFLPKKRDIKGPEPVRVSTRMGRVRPPIFLAAAWARAFRQAQLTRVSSEAMRGKA